MYTHRKTNVTVIFGCVHMYILQTIYILRCLCLSETAMEENLQQHGLDT